MLIISEKTEKCLKNQATTSTTKRKQSKQKEKKT